MLGQEKREGKKKAEETVAFANPSQHRGEELPDSPPCSWKARGTQKDKGILCINQPPACSGSGCSLSDPPQSSVILHGLTAPPARQPGEKGMDEAGKQLCVSVWDGALTINPECCSQLMTGLPLQKDKCQLVCGHGMVMEGDDDLGKDQSDADTAAKSLPSLW